ncbi:MAG: DUF86 domain-containing protein [Deltaproteobacteria bacterium]|nr:DUF86 domain-containing protein [Deltaproteobacteria bacterium]
MSHDLTLTLIDIVEACQKVLRYVEEMTREQFQGDERTVDAVIRNLEIIGEASKQIPKEVRDKYSEIEWRRISGLRDILIHGYFGIDDEIIWDIVSTRVAPLLESVKKILDTEMP